MLWPWIGMRISNDSEVLIILTGESKIKLAKALIREFDVFNWQCWLNRLKMNIMGLQINVSQWIFHSYSQASYVKTIRSKGYTAIVWSRDWLSSRTCLWKFMKGSLSQSLSADSYYNIDIILIIFTNSEAYQIP